MPFCYAHTITKLICDNTMITFCLYTVKIILAKLITKCYWSVVMATDKIQTGIRFTEDMLIKITYIAKKNHRSLNGQLEYITQNYINEYEKRFGVIQVDDEDRANYRK